MEETKDAVESEASETKLVPAETACLHLVQPFTLAGTPGCKELALRLFKACALHKGFGLAAPQLGVNASVAVVVIPQARLAFCMVNPTIKRLFGRLDVAQEGCLSLPGVRAFKLRHEMVDVIFQDQFGKTHHVVTGGLLSRVIQHEVSHLRGLLITDGTVKAAPLRNADEPQQETLPLGSDDHSAVGEVGQADVAPELPKPDETAGA